MKRAQRTLTLLAVVALALGPALTACGKKGGLEPPPPKTVEKTDDKARP